VVGSLPHSPMSMRRRTAPLRYWNRKVRRGRLSCRRG
jgi:hypothetical protein